MNFAFSEEQDEFREILRRFLAERSPSSEVHRLMETPEGYDAAVWKQLAEEMGLPGVHVPEAYGGQGFGFLELGIVMEEMGRAAYCGPFFASACLATGAILHGAGEDERKELLPRLASGEAVGTLAFLEDAGRWEASEIGLELREESGGVTLTGRKRFVLDGQNADLVVVAARREGSAGPEGVTLAVVEADAAGLTVEPLPTLDTTRKQADLVFDGVRARVIGKPGGAWPALEKTLAQAAVALAFESVGGAQVCLEMAVAYAKQRVQFAQPIGSFQAIKHKCSEMLLEIECAKSIAYWAGAAADEDGAELSTAASVAKSTCVDAFGRCAAENIQIHGGIGVTWEADPHIHFKRWRTNETLLGSSGAHRARVGELLGL